MNQFNNVCTHWAGTTLCDYITIDGKAETKIAISFEHNISNLAQCKANNDIPVCLPLVFLIKISSGSHWQMFAN